LNPERTMPPQNSDPKKGACKEPSPAFLLAQRLNASFVLTFIVSFLTWLVLSGKFDFFHLSLGVISCLIVAAVAGNLLVVPGEKTGMARQWIGFVRYLPWLLYQIFLANLHLLRLVFHPRMMDLIDPHIVKFKSDITHPMGLLIFANSITLTPGTITVFVSVYGQFTVHTIDRFSGDPLPGEMQKRVAAIFGE
jgi:multicomponent Na+:H+ antiporter subunit E